MKILIAFIRGVLLFFLISGHVIYVVVQEFLHGPSLERSLQVRQNLCRRILKLLGIACSRYGQVPPGGPYLFVGNHRSYLDPIVTHAEVIFVPVAKAEVASWPLIGYGAKITGIMFVERESQNSRAATLDAMLQILKNGYSVLVYPEGTTHTDSETRPFRRGAFSLAAKEGFPIVPLAIDYKDPADAWVGDATFLPHFFRTFGKRKSVVYLSFGEPITGTDPDELLVTAKKWIDEKLSEFHHHIKASSDIK